MRSLLGVDAKERDRAGRQLLTSIAELDDQLLPFAPLLAPIVDADVRSTPRLTPSPLSSPASGSRTWWSRSSRRCARVRFSLSPRTAHWFDDSTSEICSRLAGTSTNHPWLFCVIRRADTDAGFTPSSPQARMLLARLSDDVAKELIEFVTEVAPLRPHESDGVVSRAGGSPLFLEELLRIVRATDVDTLPDTLDAVAMREIDALPAIPRRVLRLASVLGRSFERSLLEQLLAAESVDAGADPLKDLRAQLLPDADGQRVRFRHALLQEACTRACPFVSAWPCTERWVKRSNTMRSMMKKPLPCCRSISSLPKIGSAPGGSPERRRGLPRRHTRRVRRPFISSGPSRRLAGWVTWTPMSWPRSSAISDDRSNCSVSTTGRTSRIAMRCWRGVPIRHAERRSPVAWRICRASSSDDPPPPSDS